MEATSQPCFSQNYHNTSLHSIRKQPAKPCKKTVTGLAQRMHPKVYRVEPVNFKELVQRLTGAQDHEPEVNQVESKPLKVTDDTITAKDNPFAFDLSPSSARFWEAFPLLSPANLSRW
ncbi:PREDICTED: VQ motif-containing protein 29-like [Camelina sativa]|uniref:VQ motif-containing protein 29-like n=1 Tax=Camelina sativa TaxID=90675 RepID=A0ABM0TP83_CAMSA|nr:PREDICTED: VQ motif-containing protein 29-like [Camelina sativa]